MDRFSRLYKVSQEYIKKQEERRNSLESKCSFKPKLNPKSLNLTQNQDFYVRMEKFNFIKSEKEKL